MTAATLTLPVEVTLTPEQLGHLFARLDDDAQARMLCAAAAELARVCDASPGPSWPDMQWQAAGSHLATCECSTEAGRNLVAQLHYGMENPSHE